jgi:hypothetical protein
MRSTAQARVRAPGDGDLAPQAVDLALAMEQAVQPGAEDRAGRRAALDHRARSFEHAAGAGLPVQERQHRHVRLLERRQRAQDVRMAAAGVHDEDRAVELADGFLVEVREADRPEVGGGEDVPRRGQPLPDRLGDDLVARVGDDGHGPVVHEPLLRADRPPRPFP